VSLRRQFWISLVLAQVWVGIFSCCCLGIMVQLRVDRIRSFLPSPAEVLAAGAETGL